jgi:DNA repair exonuclease SbcCD ATPase subunit
MDIITNKDKITEYSRKKSLSKKDKNDVVSSIWELYLQTKNTQNLVDDCLSFSSDVVSLLFERYKNGIADKLNDIISLIIQSPKFIDSKNDFAFDVACEIFALYINDSNCPECMFKIFNKGLFIIDKGKTFSDKSVNKFNKLILSREECKKAFFSINFNSWSRTEKQSIYKFIQVLEKKTMLDLSTNEMQEWLKKHSFDLQDRSKVIEPTFKKLKSTVADAAQLIDTLANNIAKKDEEYQKQLNTINENYRAIDKRDKELSDLKSLLNRKNIELESLQKEQARLKSEIGTKEKQFEALKNEMGQYSKVAESANNNEMVTLKNDIKNALQGEYNKYMETRESSCTEDLFETFKGRFFRIFNGLKQFGITFGGEKK